MRQDGRPLLRDLRQTRAWPVLATCVIAIATLGLLLRGQARPDGLDSVVDTTMVASLGGHRGILSWFAQPGSTIPLIAVSARHSRRLPHRQAVQWRVAGGDRRSGDRVSQ